MYYSDRNVYKIKNAYANLIEKGYAKFLGNYRGMKYNTFPQTFYHITGKPVEVYSLKYTKMHEIWP